MGSVSVSASVKVSLKYYIESHFNQTHTRYFFSSRGYAYFNEGWIRTTEYADYGYSIPVYNTYNVSSLNQSPTNIATSGNGGFQKIIIYYTKNRCKLTSEKANINFTMNDSYQYVWLAMETYYLTTNTITCGNIQWYAGIGL